MNETKKLTAEAERALEEARNRNEKKSNLKKLNKEVNGPSGPEPTRYGDWEKKGIISDF